MTGPRYTRYRLVRLMLLLPLLVVRVLMGRRDIVAGHPNANAHGSWLLGVHLLLNLYGLNSRMRMGLDARPTRRQKKPNTGEQKEQCEHEADTRRHIGDTEQRTARSSND